MLRPLSKTATVVDEQSGISLVEWEGENSSYVQITTGALHLGFTNITGLIGGGYVGWAVTDETGGCILQETKSLMGTKLYVSTIVILFMGKNNKEGII